MAGHLDDELEGRIGEVLSRRETTEPELRRLTEEGDARERLLRTELDEGERRLEAFNADPASSLTEIVEELRRVRTLRSRLDELQTMRAELDDRARELRASWLGGPVEPSPGGETAGI